jgi:hypothetical protein
MSRLEIAVALLCAELGQNGIPDLLYTEAGAEGLAGKVDKAKDKIELAFRMADLVLEREQQGRRGQPI